MSLKQWFLDYIKHRLVFQNKEINIEEKGESIIANGETYDIFENFEKLSENNIVTLNSKANLDFLINNWEKLSQNNKKIIFVNTKTNEKWIINPKLHAMVTPAKNLKKGLTSLHTSIARV